jgi:hypothetical protein
MTACLLNTKRRPGIITAFALLVIVFMPTVSRAELVDHFAQAMSGWASSLALSGGGVPTVSVEFAVFSPGSFGSGDPSNGLQYVYAYQLISDVTSPVPISKFTVGLDAGASATGIGEVDDSGVTGSGVAAYSCNITTGPTDNSAVWNYNPRMSVGAKSKLLLFVSPYEPKWLTCTVKGSAYAETGYYVPSPVPEPGTLLTLMMAGIGFILVRPIRSLFCP